MVRVSPLHELKMAVGASFYNLCMPSLPMLGKCDQAA